MVGVIMYGKIQELKRLGYKKQRAARQLEIDTKTVRKYWDMPEDEYITQPEQASDTEYGQESEEEAPEQVPAADEPDNALQPEQPAGTEPGQGDETAPAQGEETPPVLSGTMTNLFVKVTKDQREALEARKGETGENVGDFLNRVIKGFLADVKNGSLPDGFDETYDYYASPSQACNTTCSAKIPAETNDALFEYLSGTGRSRNVLMATLAHFDLAGQEMDESQNLNM